MRLDINFVCWVLNILCAISDSFREKRTLKHIKSQVQGLARDFLKDYIQVTVGSLELTASKHVEQIVEVVDDFEKANRVFKILDGVKDGDRTLIFCETKRGTDDLTRNLRRNGWPALSIHGDKSQSERDWVYVMSLPIHSLYSLVY